MAVVTTVTVAGGGGVDGRQAGRHAGGQAGNVASASTAVSPSGETEFMPNTPLIVAKVKRHQ